MANKQNDENGHEQSQVVVVMVPFPAQGHLNQLLHLSRLISVYNIPVHYVATTTHGRQAKLRIHGWEPQSDPNIHFHDVPTPHFLSPPPNPNASTKFPVHLQPSFDASARLRDPVAKVLSTLSSTARRLVVVYDALMAPTVQDVVCIPNAEAYTFQTVSAFYVYCYIWEIMGRSSKDAPEIVKDIPSNEGCLTSEMEELLASLQPYENLGSGKIYNSSKAIECQYLDLLAKTSNQKQWAIGPFNPVTVCPTKNLRHECLDWLDKQEPNSVIFVSFGTTTSLSDGQIQELAIGLEKSEQKFIWVLRESDKGDVFIGNERRAELPKGYEESVRGRGMVVRDWAPQLDILGHPSTGGFMTHCGWNSCIESITMGVPIAAWPMHSDQPRHAFLLSKILKIGIIVRDWECRDGLVTSLTVENVVKRLMASSEGYELRNRAAELGVAVREAVKEGGDTRMEMDSFVAHITR